MFGRSRRKSTGTPSRSSERKNSNETIQPVTEAFGWIVKPVQTTVDCDLSVEDATQKDITPTPPIENEPRVFDLLAADTPSFITYSTQENGDRVMASATVEKLVEKLTREMDSQFLMDFFLTYRQFMTNIKLCKLLILRFRWALLEDTDERFLVRIRTFVVIRHWLTHYWQQDFEPSRTLRFMLSTFLSEVRTHPTILQSPRDERIVHSLRTLVKQQRKLHTPAHVDPRLPDEDRLRDSSIHSSSSTFLQTQRRRQANDRLSLPKSIHNNSNNNSNGYYPLILEYRSEIIAQQFCRIEQQLLQQVTWEELIELRWRTRMAEGGVNQLINHFNYTCQWITSEIVRTPTIDIRVRVVEKYIRIANKCYRHRNYSTLMQILLGLQSPAVSRLEKTWQRVSVFEIQTLNELKEIAKPFKNWKNVREAMIQAIENIAESSAVEEILTASRRQHPSMPGRDFTTANSSYSGGGGGSSSSSSNEGCIPFLGLYLSDLVYNAELPTFLNPPSTSSCCDTPDNERVLQHDDALLFRLSTHHVNYNKHRITGKVVDEIYRDLSIISYI
ncbi:ras guanine nucleotide exchange factor domain-containing protein [Dichotomocladium elegans]|nr:ras guanine nucleotide exchange factor domain-containing protein [Dichotomocladium elegans]